MTCEICCSVPELAGKSDFLTGSCTFKKETLQKHGVSGPHLRARDGLLAKQKPLKEAPIAQSLQKGKKAVEEQNRNEMAVKINTAYFKTRFFHLATEKKFSVATWRLYKKVNLGP